MKRQSRQNRPWMARMEGALQTRERDAVSDGGNPGSIFPNLYIFAKGLGRSSRWSLPAVPALHLAPARHHLLLHRIGEWNVGETRGHLIAVLVGPLEEFQRFPGCRLIRGLLVDENEGCTGNWPGIRARLVGQDRAEAICRIPSCAGCCCTKRSCGRSYGLTLAVHHFRVVEPVLNDI